MEADARQKAGRRSVSRNTAGWHATRSATPPKLPGTRRRRAGRRSRKKPRFRGRQTSLLLLVPWAALSRFPLTQLPMTQFTQIKFAALAFHQFPQVLEQLRIPLSQDFHQERKRQRRSRTRIQ